MPFYIESFILNTPLVSIVLPIYQSNTQYLGETLESIYQQDYKSYELIISDDNPELLLDIKNLLSMYENKFDLKYFKNNEAHGIFGNLNNALKHAKGELIQIISQDDIINVEFIKDQVKCFKGDNEIGMVFSAFYDINERGEIEKSKLTHPFTPGKDVIISPEEAPEYFLSFGCLPGNISPVMISNKVLRDIGYFNQNLRFAGDYEYWVRISANYKLYYRDKAGLSVRDHPERASKFISNNQLLSDLICVYRILLDRIPDDKKYFTVKRINRRVGSTFVHHTIKNVLLFYWPVSTLVNRYKELGIYPFDPILSTYFYFISIPGRITRRFRTIVNRE